MRQRQTHTHTKNDGNKIIKLEWGVQRKKLFILLMLEGRKRNREGTRP